MRRRRFAPHLEQLETRVVLSRLAVFPVDAFDDTSDDSEREETTATETTNPRAVEDGQTATNPTPIADSPGERTPAPTRTEEPPRTDSPTTPDSDRSLEPTRSEPPTNDSGGTDSTTTPDDSFTSSDSSRIQSPEVLEPTTTSSDRETDFEPEPRTVSQPRNTADNTAGVSTDTKSNHNVANVTEANRAAVTESDTNRSTGSGNLPQSDETTAGSREAADVVETENPGDAEPRVVIVGGEEPKDPRPQPTASDVAEFVFWIGGEAKAKAAQIAPPAAVPIAPEPVQAASIASADAEAFGLALDEVFEGLPAEGTIQSIAPQALAAGVLVLKAPGVIGRLSLVWGSDEFVPNDDGPLPARRKTPAWRKRRTRKFESKESPRPEAARDRVFAESCLMSLLDIQTDSEEDRQESSLAGRAWFWTKLAAIAATLTAAAKAVYQRLPQRPFRRLKPPAPRYTGPTLWQ